MPALLEQPTMPLSAVMSEDAHDLLACFDRQLAAIIRQYAEALAIHEKSFITLDGEQFVDIDKRHMEMAGRAIFDALSVMARQGQLPQSADLDAMKNCFNSKCP